MGRVASGEDGRGYEEVIMTKNRLKIVYAGVAGYVVPALIFA